MHSWEPILAAPFILAIVIGLAWYYRCYFRTPREQRVGPGKLAPHQQRRWNRFVIAWLVLAGATWGVAALLS